MNHHNVDMQITESDVGAVVRFLRSRWSDLLQRHYMDTELIIIVPIEHVAALQEDFAIYRQLETPAQVSLLNCLRQQRYVGRMLTRPDLTPVPAADNRTQPTLF